MLVVGGDTKPASQAAQEDLINNFPEWAVTNAGANTTGMKADVPASPKPPASAPVPAGAAAPASPETPKPPKSPADKLWPVDTVPIFMRACVGLHIELIPPCKCTITKLMQQMPHDEFLELTARGTIEQDARLSTIRYECVGTPRTKSK